MNQDVCRANILELIRRTSAFLPADVDQMVEDINAVRSMVQGPDAVLRRLRGQGDDPWSDRFSDSGEQAGGSPR